jgi:hypothetical protein
MCLLITKGTIDDTFKCTVNDQRPVERFMRVLPEDINLINNLNNAS